MFQQPMRWSGVRHQKTHRQRHTAVFALTLLLGLAVGAHAQPEARALLPVPYPELEPLEPAVAAQIGEAQDLLRGALENPETPPGERAEAYAELGQLYHAYGLTEAAEACYQNLEVLTPRDPRWPHLLGILLQQAGRFEEAATAFERSLELAPDSLAGWVRLAEVELTLGRPAEATAHLQRALALDPSSAAARAFLGQAALSEKRWAEAVEQLEAALELAPEADRLHYPLGLAYRGLGEMDKAKDHLARAGSVGVRPPDPWLAAVEEKKTGERVLLLRGRRAFQAGDYAAAVEAFREAVESRPDSVRARVNLGSALGQLGDRAAAAEQYRTALELEPTNTTAHFNLAMLELQDGAVAEAIPHLQAVVEAQPEDAEAHLQLARALAATGRPLEALPHFRRAVNLDPASEDARLGEVQALSDSGALTTAWQRLEQAHADLPTSGRIAHALARLLAASPDLELRDGARAVELALRVFEARQTVLHAETVALAMAEAGRCEEAATWQSRALEAARRLERPDLAEALAPGLARYQAGAPCRPPAGTSQAAP